MQPLILLQDIAKSYRQHRALDGINLKVMPGITGLLGPNGAGKSSLIKILLGLVRITSGSGSILGHRIGKDWKKIRNDIGYMPEDDCYIPGMTGIEVVQFAARLSGLPSVEGMRRAHEILDFCDMKQERYRAIETFSTGMRQKIKFAAAIVHDPKFLILDEPTSGLDPEEREALLHRIGLLYHDAGKSVLLSTHILPDVQTICDSVVILSQGQVKLNRPLADLNRTISPTVEVSVDHMEKDFLLDLEAQGLKTARLENGNLEVIAETAQGLSEKVWSAAHRSSTTIFSLRPARNSLEATFMETVEKASQLAGDSQAPVKIHRSGKK